MATRDDSGSSAANGGVRRCGTCDAKLKVGAAYCHECGTRYVARERTFDEEDAFDADVGIPARPRTGRPVAAVLVGVVIVLGALVGGALYVSKQVCASARVRVFEAAVDENVSGMSDLSFQDLLKKHADGQRCPLGGDWRYDPFERIVCTIHGGIPAEK